MFVGSIKSIIVLFPPSHTHTHNTYFSPAAQQLVSIGNDTYTGTVSRNTRKWARRGRSSPGWMRGKTFALSHKHTRSLRNGSLLAGQVSFTHNHFYCHLLFLSYLFLCIQLGAMLFTTTTMMMMIEFYLQLLVVDAFALFRLSNIECVIFSDAGSLFFTGRMLVIANKISGQVQDLLRAKE